MRSSRIAWFMVAFALLSALSTLSPPAAAAPTAQERTAAKKLSAQGQAAFKRRRFKDAADAYRSADELNPSPQMKLNLARALVGSGRLLDARAILIAVEEAPATLPVTKRAQAAASRLKHQLEPRIPTLQLLVTGPAASAVRASVDDRELAVTREALVDPGEHVVVVEAKGFARERRQVTVAEGRHEQLIVVLEPAGEAPVRAAPAAKPAAAAEVGGSKLPAAIAFGIGAVGMGVGTVFGLLAVAETGTAKAGCEGNVCPDDPKVVSARDAALRDGNISTAGFIVGGVGVGAGIVLLLVSSGARERVPADGKAADAALWPWIGAGHAGVAGVF